MRRQVEWSDGARESLWLFVDPLPGQHDPPDGQGVASDMKFILHSLADGFDDLEVMSDRRRRLRYQEPLSAGFITVIAVEVDGVVVVDEFDAWPGEPTEDPFGD